MNILRAPLRSMLLGGAFLVVSARPVAAQQNRVQTYSAQAKPPALWSLAPLPTLVIGGVDSDGPTAFGDVIGVGVLFGGQIVVGDAEHNEVRIFDRQGNFVRSFGRSGSGPGEFSRVLWSLFSLGDTILATDNGGRAQLFDASGQLRASYARPTLESSTKPVRIGLLKGGGNAVRAVELPSGAGAPGEMVQIIRREGRAGHKDADVVRVRVAAPRQNPRSTSPLIYRPTTVVVAHNDRICVGHTARYRITCYDDLGTPRFVIERATTRRPVTEGMKRLARDGYVKGNSTSASEEDLAKLRALAGQFQFPEQVPAFGRMLVSANGELWVSSYNPPETIIGPKADRVSREKVTWSVYSRDGSWVADIEMPPRFVPYAVSEGAVYGVSLGADDMESVSVWRINTEGTRSE